jgi:hypothetical protein
MISREGFEWIQRFNFTSKDIVFQLLILLYINIFRQNPSARAFFHHSFRFIKWIMTEHPLHCSRDFHEKRKCSIIIITKSFFFYISFEYCWMWQQEIWLCAFELRLGQLSEYDVLLYSIWTRATSLNYQMKKQFT